MKDSIATEIFQQGENFRGYVIESLLGIGGLGAVYLARHELMDQLFAIKILYPYVAMQQPEYVRRFVREARIAAKINHPNLVAVHDVGYDSSKDIYYLVMEYVDGCDLRDVIALGGAMESTDAVRIVAAVANALASGEPFGVVHRDIKPENVMIAKDGMVKLVDLGVAKSRNTDSLRTMPNTVFGTPAYISPEQAQDSSSVDSRSDIYSLGVVFFELLCGKRPYECNTLGEAVRIILSPKPLQDVRTVNPSVPAPLAGLLREMLAKNPEKRIQNASSLLERLASLGYDVNTSTAKKSPVDEEKEFSYSAFGNVEQKNTFVTQDKEIMSFVKAAKQKRRRQELIRWAIPLTALALATLAVILAIAYRLS